MEAIDSPFFDALAKRDGEADGVFFYGVKTTGVYCRPSCGARAPRAENVAYFATVEAAVGAGFRACKRCRPDVDVGAVNAAVVAMACRRIEAADEVVGLGALATEAGVSASHFHRLFKGVMGVTPKAYGAAHRAGRVRAAVRGSKNVTEAVYEAGFSGPGRFYEAAGQTLGMTPGAFRAGAVGVEILYGVARCSLGMVLVGRTEVGICAVLLGDDGEGLVRELAGSFPKAVLREDEVGFGAVLEEVVGAIERPGLGVGLPTDIQGTAFQRRVWEALRGVKAGETVSYEALAERVGAPGAVRAVARACAANKVAVLVPCHRAVRKDGGVAGYRWGVERKKVLLQRERDG